MTISHATYLTEEEETYCLHRHLSKPSTPIRFIHADCEIYVKNLLSETLNKGVDRAIERLSQYKVFDSKEAEMLEKFKNSSSECLREKLMDLKYSELLLSKVSLPNMKLNKISSEHLDFERKAIVALLTCSANITFEEYFDILVELYKNNSKSFEKDDNSMYCERKYFFNDTVLSFLVARNDIDTHGLEYSDCSEINKVLDREDYANLFHDWIKKMIFDKLEALSEPCILRSIKKFPIQKFFYKLITVAGLKLYEEFKKSQKKEYVKLMTDISEDILPCIWEN